ncbi:acetate--CoA ligase family protein [Pseudaestuariivita atlantica]|uniref:Acyl-CoA synthetase n=1 Tax=Pseudaestuariivita atlantica TaxID=1317121 RepID=A0A0L1JUT7_9RHOB|nr:acetate--CoA ligase family protein [Pseudaestuariivita atlantica]KNG95531.1 acyl-CoA synthetase [Pseudaestuariivita atlantica]
MTDGLRRLLAPRSIAVVGGGAWCRNVIRAATEFGFDGPIWPVHPTRTEVAGLPAVPGVDALPDAPDAAFVGVNHAATLDVIAALDARGAGGAVAFASGFGEVEDADAGDRQARLVEVAGEMPVIGPNCYGFVNALDRAALWPDQHGLVPVARGVAIVTQSSNIAINMTMQRRGLPIAAIVTAGNQAQLGLADLGEALLRDDRITALGLHIEGVGDLRAFERMAATARALGKPVVVLKAGRSAAAREATLSHTASLAGSSAGASALFRRLGCVETEGIAAFLETLKFLHVTGPLKGGRLASMSCSGGEASLIADAVEGLPGLDWAPMTEAQRTGLAEALGPRVTLANPLDYHTYIWNDVPAMTRAYAAMLAGPQDLTLIVADFPRADRCDPADWACIVDAARDAQAKAGGRLALIASLPDTMPEDVVAALAPHGIACLSGLTEGLEAVRLAATPGPATTPDPVLLATEPRDPVRVEEGTAKDWLAAHGVPVPRRARARDAAEIADAARALTVPLVLKGEGVAHKSEAGAVRLGLTSPDAVRAAAEEMAAPGFLVEEQIEGGVAEILVGVVRDPAHGFVLTLGAGGVLTEMLRDTVSMLVPASRAEVEQGLNGLRVATLLDGYRGRPAGAKAALLDLVMAVQAAVIADAARLNEVEINPVIVTPDRAVAVDALIERGDMRDE